MMVVRLSSPTLAILALTAAGSFLFTVAARRAAFRLGVLDCPDGRRKAHGAPMPLMGGVAVYLALVGAVGLTQWLAPAWAAADPQLLRRTWVLTGTAGLFCVVGLCDDVWGMRAGTKLLLQILASLPFVFFGHSIEAVHLPGVAVELGLFGAAFTVFWLVACVNIINLVDGLDGLAGTVALIIFLATAAICHMQGKPGIAALALLVAASVLGFLVHNWPPAKIFLGDSGSLTLGFLVGALAIESSMKTATSFALAIPLVLVSVPVFDTFMAIVRRKLTGRGIGEADRGHIHHCLQDRGLSRKQSLLAISGLCVATAVLTVFAAWTNNEFAALGLCLVMLVLLVLGRIFGYHETMLFYRHVQALGYLLADTSGIWRTRLLLARVAPSPAAAHTHEDYWQNVTRHVQAMGGVRLELVCRDKARNEIVSQLLWESEPSNTPHAAEWQFSYTVPGRGVYATLTATGHSRAKLRGQRMIDLFRVFDSFCLNWIRAHHSASILPMRPAVTVPLRATAESAQHAKPSPERRVA